MLTLALPDARTWTRFVAGESLNDDPMTTAVCSRWRRVAEAGAACEGPAHPEGVDSAALRERRERLAERFQRSELLVDVPREILAAGYTALLADDEGVIVRAQSSDAFSDAAARARLVEGARWNEMARGTNAIGTSLLEGASVAVVGAAHFERANHQLVCYAAPVRDPSGRVLAVFDVTSYAHNADPMVGVLVQAVASSMELALREAAKHREPRGGLRMLEVLVQRASGAALLVERGGHVRMANAGSTVRTLRELGLVWSDVEQAVRGRGALAAPGTGQRFDLEPVFDDHGDVSSVVMMATTSVRSTPPARVAPSFASVPAKGRAEPSADAFEAIVGSDPVIVQARAMARRFASSHLPILLLAETGSGKELFARAIHAASPRARGPFVAVNCGAVAPSLLESELFGYAPGAFTGAHARGHGGKFGAARGGTLFLDEIAEMPPALQAALLRVLEDGSYYRLGESTETQADVRIVCATCRDVPRMIADGSFRKDLYYRIRGAALTLPSLASRADRLEVAEALLARLAQTYARAVAPMLTDAARQAIDVYRWPGNVRELRMALEHALVMAGESDVIDVLHLPPELREPAAREPVIGSRREAETAALRAALARHGGNLTRAAEELGVARTTLYRMLRRAPVA